MIAEVIKFIQEILKTNKKVYIPNLGQFEISMQKARYDSVKGMFLPTQIVVAYRRVQNINDDSLVKYIAKNKLCSMQEAELYVDNFSKNAITQIEKYGQYVIPGIGKLFYSIGNIIDFEQSNELVFNKSHWNLTPVSSKKVDPVYKKLATEVGLGEKRTGIIKRSLLILLSISIILIIGLSISLGYQYYQDKKAKKILEIIGEKR